MHKILSILLTLSFTLNAFSLPESKIEKLNRLEKEMIQLKLDIQEAKSNRKTVVRLTVAAGVVSALIGGVGAAMISGNQTGPMARIITQNGKLILMGDVVPVLATTGGLYLISLNSKQLDQLERDVDQKTAELAAAKSILESDSND